MPSTFIRKECTVLLKILFYAELFSLMCCAIFIFLPACAWAGFALYFGTARATSVYTERQAGRHVGLKQQWSAALLGCEVQTYQTS